MMVLRAALPFFLAATSVAAQEKEPPSPWKHLKGALAGAVGTCPPVDGEADAGLCYLVRCDPSRGLVFVIQDASLEDFGVESVRLSAGKFDQTFTLTRRAKNLGEIALATEQPLLQALKSEHPGGMVLRTAKARNSYSTAFELTGARGMIASIEKTCQPR